ncbi:MAG: 5' nucleotidase, NT5C type [Eubacteriales bacterium]
MRLGVDIDGVLADSLALWVRELNRFFRKEKKVEEIHLYDISQTYGITSKQLEEFMSARGSFIMSQVPLMRDAGYYLRRIRHYHEIFIVTAREDKYERETREWLLRHGLPHDELVLLGSHQKQSACKGMSLGALVEDTLEIGLNVSAAGVPVLLFDAPYNQGSLPPLVFRQRSWEEVFRTVVAGMHDLLAPGAKGGPGKRLITVPGLSGL